jgi:hypothetical protein
MTTTRTEETRTSTGTIALGFRVLAEDSWYTGHDRHRHAKVLVVGVERGHEKDSVCRRRLAMFIPAKNTSARDTLLQRAS